MGSASSAGDMDARRAGRTRRPTVVSSLAIRLAMCGILLLVGMAGCSTAPGASSTTTGINSSSLDHLHDMLPLHGMAGTMLVATHLGLYRTTDRGQTWVRSRVALVR